MPRFYFHLSRSDEFIFDKIGSDIPDVTAAHFRAVKLVDRMMNVAGLVDSETDWRRWKVHVIDQNRLPIFVVLFPASFIADSPKPLGTVNGARALHRFLDATFVRNRPSTVFHDATALD